MKTTIVTSTHKVTFETMGEAKELHGILGSTIRAWELAGVKEMGPIKPIPSFEKDPILDGSKDPILDETV